MGAPQFKNDGCDNCEDLELHKSMHRVNAFTSPHFAGYVWAAGSRHAEASDATPVQHPLTARFVPWLSRLQHVLPYGSK